MFKKVLKKIIALLIIIILIWVTIFIINIVRCINYKRPIRLLTINEIEDEFVEMHKYIGYTIDVNKYGDKVIKTKITFLNNKLLETDDLLTINRTPENVKIEVIQDSINKSAGKIVITDNNEFSYGWSDVYKIEQKINDNWRELKLEKGINVDIDNIRDENNQIIIEIDWSQFYEQLSNGTYRIVKNVYDNVYGYIDICSNEFEIHK